MSAPRFKLRTEEAGWVLELVAAELHTAVWRLRADRRNARVSAKTAAKDSWCRFVLWHLLVRVLGFTPIDAGRVTGGKTRSAVEYGLKVIDDAIEAGDEPGLEVRQLTMKAIIEVSKRNAGGGNGDARE